MFNLYEAPPADIAAIHENLKTQLPFLGEEMKPYSAEPRAIEICVSSAGKDAQKKTVTSSVCKIFTLSAAYKSDMVGALIAVTDAKELDRVFSNAASKGSFKMGPGQSREYKLDLELVDREATAPLYNYTTSPHIIFMTPIVTYKP